MAANPLRKKAEKELTKLTGKPNNIFKQVKFMKKDGTDNEGRCRRAKAES